MLVSCKEEEEGNILFNDALNTFYYFIFIFSKVYFI